MKNEYNHLWNDLPHGIKRTLMPHMIESQILLLEQGKSKAIKAHRALLADFNNHIKNLKESLPR